MEQGDLNILLDKFDFDSINKKIKDKVENVDANQFLFFREYNKLAKLCFSICEELPVDIPSEKDFKKISLDLEEVAIEFFNFISPELAIRCQNILRYEKDENGEYKVFFTHRDIESCIDEKGKVSIGSIDGTINDLLSFVHEIFHKFSFPYKQESFLISFFSEATSITGEFLLRDYIKENYPQFLEDMNRWLKLRWSYTYCHSAIYIVLDSILLDLYEKYGEVTKNNLLNYIDNMPDTFMKIFITQKLKFRLKYIIDKNDFMSFEDCNYLSAFFVAIDLEKRIFSCLHERQLLIDFISILGMSDFEAKRAVRILRGLNLPIVGKEVGVLIPYGKGVTLNCLSLAYPISFIDDNLINISDESLFGMKLSVLEFLNGLLEEEKTLKKC